jgi:hypothetical protein
LVGRLDRAPNGAFPVTPMVHAGIPHDLSPRGPRRRRWRRARPWRSPVVAGRATVIVVPVTAVVPVLVGAPAWFPLLSRAPVVVIHRYRRRSGLGGARGQPQRGHSQTAGRQRTGAQANPRSFLRVGIHEIGMPSKRYVKPFLPFAHVKFSAQPTHIWGKGLRGIRASDGYLFGTM